jgi:hypothetical protein
LALKRLKKGVVPKSDRGHLIYQERI